MSLLLFLVAIVNLLFGGYVFMAMWNWFPSEILGVTTIGYASAIGMMLFISLLRSKSFDEKSAEESLKHGLSIMLYYAITLGVGFIVSSFIN